MDHQEQALRDEYEKLQKTFQDSSIFSDPTYPKLAKRSAGLEKIIQLFDEIDKLRRQQKEAETLASGEGEMAELASSELDELNRKLSALSSQLSALNPINPQRSK